jgi:hypothetical protein
LLEDPKNEKDADFIYHGFSVCDHHFQIWHGAVLKERDEANSKIIKPNAN